MYDGLKETFFISESFVHVPPGSQEAGQHAGRRLVQDRAAAKGMGRRMGGGRRRVASGRLVAWAIYSAGAGVRKLQVTPFVGAVFHRTQFRNFFA
jgi:hypothetical protein